MVCMYILRIIQLHHAIGRHTIGFLSQEAIQVKIHELLCLQIHT